MQIMPNKDSKKKGRTDSLSLRLLFIIKETSVKYEMNPSDAGIE